MKRWMIFGLAVVLLMGFSLPAGAKMIPVGKNIKGDRFYVIDRIFKKQGDCLGVVTVFQMVTPRKTKYGMVKQILRAINVCCQFGTIQTLGFRYLDAANKVIYDRKIPAMAAKRYKPKPGTLGALLFKKVCAPGFPGTSK